MSLLVEPPATKKDVYQKRIAAMVDQIMADDEDQIYREVLDRRETIAEIVEAMRTFSVAKFLAIDDNDLRQRVKPMMTIFLLPHLLDGMSDAEKEDVFAAIEGR